MSKIECDEERLYAEWAQRVNARVLATRRLEALRTVYFQAEAEWFAAGARMGEAGVACQRERQEERRAFEAVEQVEHARVYVLEQPEIVPDLLHGRLTPQIVARYNEPRFNLIRYLGSGDPADPANYAWTEWAEGVREVLRRIVREVEDDG